MGVSRYQDGELVAVKLYPIELVYDGPDSRLGIPRLAQGGLGQRIIERVQRLSRDLDTAIQIEGVSE